MKIHTFLVLAYKESPYLEACLKSLLAQKTPSEIVICSSTPSSFLTEIASRYGLELKINPVQQGIGADWEFAYAQAQTPYLTLAHQDDEYDPNYTLQLLALAESLPEATLLFPAYAEIVGAQWQKNSLNLVVKRAMLRLSFGFSHAIRSTFWKRISLSIGNPICCPAVMYHKRAIGALSFPKEKRFVLDWEVWIDLAKRAGDFVYLPQCLMGHRIHPDSETTKVTESDLRSQEEREMFYKLWPKPVAFSINLLYALGHHSNRRQ